MHSSSLQPTLSTFFQSSPRKRDSSFIDLTQDEDSESTVQKRKRLSATASHTNSKSRSSLVDSWCFSPDKANQTKSSTATTSTAENKRHEAFKRKLLQDNSIFLSRKSEDAEEGQVDEPKATGDLAHDELFETLHEAFAHKSSVQERGKATQESLKRKRAIEIGPSGEPYTPLEKQVCRSYYRIIFVLRLETRAYRFLN